MGQMGGSVTYREEGARGGEGHEAQISRGSHFVFLA
jgi:hypothetical protein